MLDKNSLGSTLEGVLEEPPSPSPQLHALVIEHSLPRIMERPNLPEQARSLGAQLRLDFERSEGRDAMLALQQTTERGLAFIRDLSDYAEVLGVPASTVLKQILLTRMDVGEEWESMSSGPLTGISREAFIESFTKEDVEMLQAEASFIGMSLEVDLSSKAGLPRARSSLANCAALLSALWDAADETDRSAAELLREWGQERKSKGG